jgi:Tfp pilus assembly protein PilZ
MEKEYEAVMPGSISHPENIRLGGKGHFHLPVRYGARAANYSGVVLDLNGGGLRIQGPKSYTPGTRLFCVLQVSENEVINLPCEMRWSQPGSLDEPVMLGLKLIADEVRDRATLDKVTGQFRAKSKLARHRVPLKVQFPKRFPDLVFQTWDLSLGGIFVLWPVGAPPVRVNDRLQAEIDLPGESEPLRVCCETRHVSESPRLGGDARGAGAGFLFVEKSEEVDRKLTQFLESISKRTGDAAE